MACPRAQAPASLSPEVFPHSGAGDTIRRLYHCYDQHVSPRWTAVQQKHVRISEITSFRTVHTHTIHVTFRQE
jgi:DNA-binding transcriptional regulator PaaX